jgi:hypothetical protein
VQEEEQEEVVAAATAAATVVATARSGASVAMIAVPGVMLLGMGMVGMEGLVGGEKGWG